MADADREALIASFKDVTGVDTGRAQFFLESSGWQIEVSSESYILLIVIFLFIISRRSLPCKNLTGNFY